MSGCAEEENSNYYLGEDIHKKHERQKMI